MDNQAWASGDVFEAREVHEVYEAIRLWFAFTFMPVHGDMLSYVSSIRKWYIYIYICKYIQKYS